MYNLSVLKVKDPSCFFCEILKEGVSKEYEEMFAEINFLYSTVYRNVEELKPTTLPVGTFCIVFYEKMKSWCRAILESTTCSAHDELVECFLVDFALFSPIKKTNIRFPLEQFHKLPFRARKFKLHHVQPVSLRIDLFANKSELRPAKRWDIAAIHYFQQLLEESLKIEAQLCSLEDGYMIVDLYVTTADSVICANDDLVAKKYAWYENGNPQGKIENGGLVISSAQTLQRECTSIPLIAKSPHIISDAGAQGEVADNTIAGIRKFAQTHIGMTRSHDSSPVRIESPEKLHQSQQKLQTPESSSRVESDPAQFVWPAWSSRDQRRRLSAEFTEKSLAKLSSVGENKTEVTKAADTKQGLTRLLHFLNPTPKQLPEEESSKSPKMIKPQSAVFASNGLPPVSTLEEATLCADIKKRLVMCGYEGPSLTESYCWAPIAGGFDTIVISPDGSKPIYYIPPLLSYLNCASVAYKLLPAKHGPHAVILCPGWNKAHSVYNMLMEFSKNTRPLSPMLLLVGLKKEELQGLNLRKQCEVIVTTPQCLLRCLEHHGLLLLRLCHLVFDEVDLLFSKAGSEMSEILQIYKKIVTVENRDGTPQQIVAVGSKWTQDMQLLLQYMTAPRTVITSMEQAAVFANVQQVVQLCLDCEKMSILMRCFDFTPVDVQKILIFTKTDEEAELVHKAVQTASAYSLLLHKGLLHLFSHVLQQWRTSFSCRTVVVLVVTDDYAPLLEITDATCVIHYSFPENVGVLSHRLFSLLDYIQSRIDKISMEEDDRLRAKSILILTEEHDSYGIHLLRSLRQAQADVPPELVALAQGLLEAWKNKKRDQKLCLHLKTFGYCNEEEDSCPHRHHINPSLDLHDGVAAIPESDQYITVLPLCIVDAARFLGRVVIKNDPYDKLAAELNEFYESPMNKVPARNVQCQHLYALSDGSHYHRVQVLSTEIMGSVSYAHVQYIDDGKADKIPVHRLFLLQPAFQSVPQQLREFIVCRVKPIDNEDKWDPKVARVITRSIQGKPHRAKVVLKLGKTYWLDPMVQMTPLSELSSYAYELNVRQEILSTGLGTDNPQHILKLTALLEPSGSSQVSGRREENENVVISEKSTEDNNMSAPQCLEKEDSDYKNNVVGDSLSTRPDGEGEQLKEIAARGDSEPLRILPSSLYPEVKWFEKADTVTLTVKLQHVTDPKCVFYSDRLVFSCYAGGKFYGADMELYKDIVRDKSTCTLKNGEAVITIQKSKAEMWNRLLKYKHPNVSFDFNHLEESEDFEGFKAGFKSTMKFYNVVSEDLVSSEYSESDSD
ncbi:putative ATP-dependent RNA helicase TDRD12 [Eleutherodactylus coqui]|uniref:putative ATP-dependent RNA helicase TDRD12 n=1 Tax=Eleutherodactylus coqui TaxID=57060 RepID=UPI0034622F2D